jgi:hypothetical protein
MLYITFNREELSKILRRQPNGSFGFCSKASAKDLEGKVGYTQVMRPKLETGINVRGISVCDPLRMSGQGETGTLRLYWLCPHGRVVKEEEGGTKTKINRECCIGVSCLASDFHPDQDELAMEVSPSKCVQCLFPPPSLPHKLPLTSTELPSTRTALKSPSDIEPVPKRIRLKTRRSEDLLAVKKSLDESYETWKETLSKEQDVLPATPVLLQTIQTSLSSMKMKANVFSSSKELEHMTADVRNNYTVLSVPKKTVKVSSLMVNLATSSDLSSTFFNSESSTSEQSPYKSPSNESPSTAEKSPFATDPIPSILPISATISSSSFRPKRHRKPTDKTFM